MPLANSSILWYNNNVKQELISTLKSYIGLPLTPEMAAEIFMVAERMDQLVSFVELSKIEPEQCGEFVFKIERLEAIIDEMRPLHQEHWNETEAAHNGTPFNPDYATFFRYERAGRCVVFTVRKDGRLMGNFSLYIDRSMHTQTLIASEDTLFLVPDARRGGVAKRFIGYAEKALYQLGVKEINVSVKNSNPAGRFFQIVGYKPVSTGLSKILGE